MTEKPVYVYNLFDGPKGLTNNSQCYRGGVKIIVVAAVSIKQAYYLAGNDEWFDGDIGIIETYMNPIWTDYDGKELKEPNFGFGKTRRMPNWFIKKWIAS